MVADIVSIVSNSFVANSNSIAAIYFEREPAPNRGNKASQMRSITHDMRRRVDFLFPDRLC